MNNEKVVQDAIQNALCSYFSLNGRVFTLHGPSNRSQGFGVNDYCADLIGVLDNAQVILLEVKFQKGGKLHSFDNLQHENLVEYEDIGVPVAYAYNSVSPKEIAHYLDPQPEDWAVSTLKQIIRSSPRPLPGETPSLDHGSLWDWLLTSADAQAFDFFGKILGAWKAAPNLRNGKMVLIYAAKRNVVSLLSSQDLQVVSKFLRSKTFNPVVQKKVLQILQASDDANYRILKLHNSSKNKSSKPDGIKP